MTDAINTILQWLGYFFGKLVNVVVAAFVQLFQWLGEKIAAFTIGLLSSCLSALPGITYQDAGAAAVFARAELEKWNNLFPIYEALSCLTVIFTFRIFMGVWRAHLTMVWHAGNLHNALPKIGGTG